MNIERKYRMMHNAEKPACVRLNLIMNRDPTLLKS